MGRVTRKQSKRLHGDIKENDEKMKEQETREILHHIGLKKSIGFSFPANWLLWMLRMR